MKSNVAITPVRPPGQGFQIKKKYNAHAKEPSENQTERYAISIWTTILSVAMIGLFTHETITNFGCITTAVVATRGIVTLSIGIVTIWYC